MTQFWLLWHSLPAVGHAGIVAAIAGAFIAGLFGILHALIRDHPKTAVGYAIALFALFGSLGISAYLSYRPPPSPPTTFFTPKALDPKLFFVYITTDIPANLTSARRAATRARAKIERLRLSISVHIYVKGDQSRSAVGIGELASEVEAQQLLNRVAAEGWGEAARNPSDGWIQVE